MCVCLCVCVVGGKNQALELYYLSSKAQVLLFSSQVNLSKIFIFSVLQISYLYNKGNISTYLIRVLKRLK